MFSTVQVLHQSQGMGFVSVQSPLPAQSIPWEQPVPLGQVGHHARVASQAQLLVELFLTMLSRPSAQKGIFGARSLPGINQDCWRWSSWDMAVLPKI